MNRKQQEAVLAYARGGMVRKCGLAAGGILPSARAFGDFTQQRPEYAYGTAIPPPMQESILGPAATDDRTGMVGVIGAQTPTSAIPVTQAEKDMASGHNPNGPYRYDAQGNKVWIGESRNPQSLAGSAAMTQEPAVMSQLNGTAKETPEQLLARMNAKYGVSVPSTTVNDQPRQPAPPPQAVANPANAAITAGSQIGARAPTGASLIDVIKNRASATKAAAGYQVGGLVRFAGPGGPRDDEIPVKVAGQEIKVSDGENALILPAKTANNPEAIRQIGGIIQNTNDGIAPRMPTSAPKYRPLDVPYLKQASPTAQEVYGSSGPVSGFTDTEKSLKDYAVMSSLLPATTKAIRDYVPAAQKAADAGEYAKAVGLSLRGAVDAGSGLVGDAFNVVANPVSKAAKAFVVGTSGSATTGNVAQANYSNEGHNRPEVISKESARLRDSIGSAGDASITPYGNLQFTDRGFNPLQHRFEDGTGAITSKTTGKTMIVTPVEYTAADGTPTNDWSKTKEYSDAIHRQQLDKIRLAELQAQNSGVTRDPQAIAQTAQGMAQSAAMTEAELKARQQALSMGEERLQHEQELRHIGSLMTSGKTQEIRDAATRAYHAMTGKGRAEQEQYDNIVVKDYDPSGMVIGEHIEQRPKNGLAASATTPSTPKSFRTQDEAERARSSGAIKSGEIIIINGRVARVG